MNANLQSGCPTNVTCSEGNNASYSRMIGNELVTLPLQDWLGRDPLVIGGIHYLRQSFEYGIMGWGSPFA